jgi:hypothetical protein
MGCNSCSKGGVVVSEKVGVNTELIKKVKEKAETLETIMDTK